VKYLKLNRCSGNDSFKHVVAVRAFASSKVAMGADHTRGRPVRTVGIRQKDRPAKEIKFSRCTKKGDFRGASPRQ